MIPFGPFEPDRTIFAPQATTSMKNSLPVADGWGPMKSLQTYSNALPAQCLGAVYVRTSSGNFTVIAGTQTGLYRLNTATLNWDDIGGSSKPYSVPSGDKWSFARFGTKLIACNLNDPPQTYDVDAGGTFADLGGSPPKAKYAWVAGDFLVLGHLESYPTRVQWSGINESDFWTVGEKGSDFQSIPDGEDVTGGIGEPNGAIIIQRRAMRFMQFSPASGYTFGFTIANPERGCIAPLSIVQIGPRDFAYLTEDGFFRGVQGQAIGAEKVDRWFLEQIDLDNLATVRGVADPFNKIVWWQYEDASSTAYLLGYDWQLNRWCFADNNVTELAALVTSGTTVEGLDAFNSNLDLLTPSLDSRVWKGGRPTFAGFTTDHRLAFFDGSNQAAEFETADVELHAPLRAFVNGCRVFTDADDYTVQVAGSDFHGGTVTYDTAASPESTGETSLSNEARLHRFKVSIAAGDVWNHALGVRPVSVPAGEV